MYSHYQVSSTNTLIEYNNLIQKFNPDNFSIKEETENSSKGEKKVTSIIRTLGIFECMRSFFELSMASLRACCCKEQPFLSEAWAALKNRQWIQIVELKNAPAENKVNQLVDHFQKPQPIATPPPVVVKLEKIDFSNAETREKFEKQLIEIIKVEAPKTTLPPSSSSKFRALFVNACLKGLSSLDATEDETNAERIDTMLENPLEMNAFVKGLSLEGNHSSLFKFLLKERRHVEALSAREARVKRLTAAFKLLSESQFDAMIKSGEFLEMCGIKECRKAIVNSFSAEQLGKFASSWKDKSLSFQSILKIQDCLQEIIKGLPTDDLLLGKLVAILPHIASACKKDFIKQLAALPTKSRPGFVYDPKDVVASAQGLFKKTLEALTLQYAKENDLRIHTPATKTMNNGQGAATPPKPQKHFEVSTGHLNTVYHTEEIKKKPFGQAEMDQLIQALESKNRNFEPINAALSSMDKPSIEKFVRTASSEALERFWEVESKTENAGSLRKDRVTRLKWVFAALSDEQIKSATNYESFLKIMTDDTNGCSEAVGEAFTSDQLALIASNWKTHVAFIKVIVKLGNEKFSEFLPKLTPHCTPFLKNALINKIDRCPQIKVKPRLVPNAIAKKIKSKNDFRVEIEAQCNVVLAQSDKNGKELSQAWWLYYGENSSWL